MKLLRNNEHDASVEAATPALLSCLNRLTEEIVLLREEMRQVRHVMTTATSTGEDEPSQAVPSEGACDHAPWLENVEESKAKPERVPEEEAAGTGHLEERDDFIIKPCEAEKEEQNIAASDAAMSAPPIPENTPCAEPCSPAAMPEEATELAAAQDCGAVPTHESSDSNSVNTVPHSVPPPSVRWQEMGEWLLEKGTAFSRFLGLNNLWVLAGVGILFLGLVFLVRQAAAAGLLGPELRMAGVSLTGLTMLALGWYLRLKRPDLGLILQGGGVGALYLTVVGSVQLYQLLPSTVALGILVVLVVFSTFLALAQHSRIMAHVAHVAGFASPILISTGGGSALALFSYYVLLNLGVIASSRVAGWRSLHLTAFCCTLSIGALWGAKAYTPELFWVAETFLLIFFFMFTYLALQGELPGVPQKMRRRIPVVDIPLTLGTSLAFLFFQAALTKHMPFVLAFSTLGQALLYMGITQWFRRASRKGLEELRREMGATSEGNLADASLLADEDKQWFLHDLRQRCLAQSETYLLFSIIAANLALPLALGNLELERWNERLLALVWSVEGAALFFLGRRQHNTSFCWLGLIALVLGVGVHLFSFALQERHVAELRPMFTAANLSALLLQIITAGSLFCAALAIHVHPWSAVAESEKAETEEEAPEKESGLLHAVKLPFVCMKKALCFLQNWLLRSDTVLMSALLMAACFWYHLAVLYELRPITSFMTSLSLSLRLGFHGFPSLIWPVLLMASLALSLFCQWEAKRRQWSLLLRGQVMIYLPLVVLTAFCLKPFSLLLSGSILPFMAFEGGMWGYRMLFCLSVAAIVLVIAVETALLYAQGGFRKAFMGRWRVLAVLTVAVCMSDLLLAGLLSFTPVFKAWGNLLLLTLPLGALWIMGRFYSPVPLLCLAMGRPPKRIHLRSWERPVHARLDSLRQMWALAALLPMLHVTAWMCVNLLGYGNPAPLPYIPLFNPVDLGMAGILILLYPLPLLHSFMTAKQLYWLKRPLAWVLTAFLVGHISLARFCFYWGDQSRSLLAAVGDPLFQALLALYWGCAGFAIMVFGNRRSVRLYWMCGMALMVIDVIKLFIVDLSRIDATWRIVAFMGVGILLICIGYFVPLPAEPRVNAENDSAEQEKDAEDKPPSAAESADA